MTELQQNIKTLIDDAKNHHDINVTSAKLAQHFINIMGNINADLSFHPNGNILICFRNEYTIMTMMAVPKNYIVWAYCVPLTNDSKTGRFPFSLNSEKKDIPEALQKLMRSFDNEN